MTSREYSSHFGSIKKDAGRPKEFAFSETIEIDVRPLRLLILLFIMLFTFLFSSIGPADARPLSEADAIRLATKGKNDDDFLISLMGSVENIYANNTVIARGNGDEVLVIWEGNYGWTQDIEDDQFIFARLINAKTGELLGDRSVLVSRYSERATQPDVVYNPKNEEYFVVWSSIQHGSGEQEIYGTRIGNDGETIGNPVRLTHVGPDFEADYEAREPAVAYTDSVDLNQYLVVWSADEPESGLAPDEYEIYGNYVDEAGQPLGSAFRISEMGPDGDAGYQVATPDVAYNSTTRQFLIVWRGEDHLDGKLGEWEIYGRHIYAVASTAIGEQTRLTNMGTDRSTGYDAMSPKIAFNRTVPDPQYLLVWRGDQENLATVNNEFEIFSQLLEVESGDEWEAITLKGNMERVSFMGPEKDALFDAYRPDVVFNEVRFEYFVTWIGKDEPDNLEIHGQRMSSSGSPLGSNKQISDLNSGGLFDQSAYESAVAYDLENDSYFVVFGGPHDDPPIVASQRFIYGQALDSQSLEKIWQEEVLISDPRFNGNYYYSIESDIAYSPVHQEFFVVWEANNNEEGYHQNKSEIYGQRIDALTGALEGPRIRISSSPQPNLAEYYSVSPAVAYSDAADAYLVAWQGFYPINGTGQLEIWGTRVDAGSGQILQNDKRYSFMGPDDDPDYDAFRPDVAYNNDLDLFLVVWDGTDDRPGLALDDDEVYGQLVNSKTGQLQGDNIRISFAGPDGEAAYDVSNPKAVYNPTEKQFFVIWEGEDNDAGDDPLGNEIYGQRVSGENLAPAGAKVRISFIGSDGDGDYDADKPALAFNSIANQYLVVWEATVTHTEGSGDKDDIFGQLLDARDLSFLGEENFRISQSGPDNDADLDGTYPAAAYDPQTNSYIVVFESDPQTNGDAEIYSRAIKADGSFAAEQIQVSDAGTSPDNGYGAFEPAVAVSDQENRFLISWDGLQAHELVGPLDEEIYGKFLGAIEVEEEFRVYLPMARR